MREETPVIPSTSSQNDGTSMSETPCSPVPSQTQPMSPFKIPTFYRKQTKARRSAPYGRVLTDENVMNDKRKKLREKQEAEERKRVREEKKKNKQVTSRGKGSKGCKGKALSGKRKSSLNSSDENECENVQCLFCEGWFLDGTGGTWCMCIQCREWCHCECAGLDENDVKDYTCDMCVYSKK